MKDRKHYYKEAMGFSIAVHIAGFFLIVLLGLVWPTTTDDIIEVTLAAGDVNSVLDEGAKEIPKQEDKVEQEAQVEQPKVEEKIVDPTLPPEIKPEQKPQEAKKKKVVSGEGTDGPARRGDGGQDDVTSMPKILKQVKPDYPPAARNMDKQGRVLVELLISSRGVVEQATIVQSGGFAALDEAVLKAVYKWRFAAAKNRYGRPCACKVVIPIKFQLK